MTSLLKIVPKMVSTSSFSQVHLLTSIKVLHLLLMPSASNKLSSSCLSSLLYISYNFNSSHSLLKDCSTYTLMSFNPLTTKYIYIQSLYQQNHIIIFNCCKSRVGYSNIARAHGIMLSNTCCNRYVYAYTFNDI